MNNLVKVNCAYCNKELFRHPYRIRISAKHFCDTKCMGHWQSANMVGEKALRYKGATITLSCDYCHVTFKTKQSFAKKRKHHFCSYSCMGKWNSAHPRGKTHRKYFGKLMTRCDSCGAEYKCFPSALKHGKKYHFCSAKCRLAYFVGSHSPNWRGGKYPNRGPSWKYRSCQARKRDGYKCQHCGITQRALGEPLQVHHIKPFREFGYIPDQNRNDMIANRLENLISLCRQCHYKAERGIIPVQPKIL